MPGRLHRLDVNGGDTAYRILHDNIDHALAVRHALLRHAAEIDRAEHRAVFGVDHRRVLRWVTEDVDPLIEGVEVDAIRPGGADINGLDQGHRLRVEHRYFRMVASEAVAGLRIDGGAIPS